MVRVDNGRRHIKKLPYDVLKGHKIYKVTCALYMAFQNNLIQIRLIYIRHHVPCDVSRQGNSILIGLSVPVHYPTGVYARHINSILIGLSVPVHYPTGVYATD